MIMPGFVRKTPAPRRSRLALVSFAAIFLAAGSLLGCAKMFKPKTPGDPIKMSRSETELAADTWQRQGETRIALEHALKAVDLDPKNADAAHLAALLYLDFCRATKIGECRLKEAEKHARNAIAQRKPFLEAENTLAVILIHQKRFEDAEKILIPITENILYSTPEIAWGNLGWAYLLSGKTHDAIVALRRAVAAQPLFCVGNYRLGKAYRREGAMESAAQALDRAVETDAPGCGQMQDAYLERAEVYLALGEVDRTRADLDRCIGLSPGTSSGKRCTELMASLK
jgi:Tfp pilus assembly protein PilF